MVGATYSAFFNYSAFLQLFDAFTQKRNLTALKSVGLAELETPATKEEKYLGVTINKRLTCDTHIRLKIKHQWSFADAQRSVERTEDSMVISKPD